MYESLSPLLSAEDYARLLDGLTTIVSVCMLSTLLTILWLAVVLIYCQWRSDADTRRRGGCGTEMRDLEGHA